MLTSDDIKNVVFNKSISGYKREEVDAFLDKVESDLVKFEKLIADYQAKCDAYQAEIDENKKSQDIIQNALINAQKLADKIVNDAKVQSEEIVSKAEESINKITLREKELAEVFEQKANERKEALKIELDEMIKKANLKAKSVNDATEDCIKRQQVLFDKLKLEIASFKSNITSKYKEHLSILQDIPDTVEMDPQQVAEIVSKNIDELPDIASFITTEEEPAVDEFVENKEEEITIEKPIEETDLNTFSNESFDETVEDDSGFNVNVENDDSTQ